MRNRLRLVAVAAALFTCSTQALALETSSRGAPSPMPNVATGQSNSASPEKLSLTFAQKQKMIQGLAEERTQVPPSGFRAAVGAKVPSAVSLSPVPLAVSNKIPETKDLSYAKLANTGILLVDPKDRAIAEVISPRASTTGNSSSPK